MSRFFGKGGIDLWFSLADNAWRCGYPYSPHEDVLVCGDTPQAVIEGWNRARRPGDGREIPADAAAKMVELALSRKSRKATYSPSMGAL